MTIKQIDSLADVGKNMLAGSVLFWLVETIIFALMYGFHYEPINDLEKTMDALSVFGMGIGFSTMLYAGVKACLLVSNKIEEIQEDEQG